MSSRSSWLGRLGSESFLVPYRHDDAGWFDYQPMSPIYPAAVWNLSMEPADWERIDRIRLSEAYDWNQVIFHRGKEDAGHEQPWLRFIAGENPGYPEAILGQSYGQLCRRLELIRQDQQDLAPGVDIHHWQELNPVTTEALVQLTLGAPQVVYNGGLLMCRVRCFDIHRQRPGLPVDVAALVEKLDANRTVLKPINLSPIDARDVSILAAGFGEHHIRTVTFTFRTSEYPGPADYFQPGSEEPVKVEAEWRMVEADWQGLRIHMPPATEIELQLDMARFANTPSYAVPARQSATPSA